MKGKHVFIISNDIADLEILEEAIKAADSNVCCLSFIFADEALRIIGSELNTFPHYIFIDVDLSRVTGADCLRTLKGIPKLSSCKIIMFAEVMPTAVGNTFIEQGAFDFFQKPVDRSSYRIKIENIFDKMAEVSFS